MATGMWLGDESIPRICLNPLGVRKKNKIEKKINTQKLVIFIS
jgi:hypothetical protein